VTGILLVVAAPYIAAFFEDARLEPIVYVMAGTSLVNGLSNIGVVDFQRFLDFERDFQLMVRTKLAGFIVTIALAVAMRNYWALVIGILSGRLAELALSYTMHAYRPRLSLRKTREIMRFSVWLLANNILFFTQRRCDFAIIGKLLDSASLGLYAVAHEIASMVTSELVQPIQRVLLPGLAKLAQDREQISRAFLDCLAVTVMVGLPIAAGIGLTADPLIRLALGAKWTGAIPLLQILIIIGIARVCSSNTGAFFLAFNQPRLTTCSAAVAAIVGVPLILWGAWHAQMIGAAWGAAATAILVVLVNYTLLWRMFGLSPVAVLVSVWRSVVSCLAMAGIVLALPEIGSRTEGAIGLFLALLFMTLVGAAAYIATHLALWRLSASPAGAEAHALALIRKSVDRFRVRPIIR
jgi:O-antigen/teichoic acid export membrane protein